jgi:hypothetical protein
MQESIMPDTKTLNAAVVAALRSCSTRPLIDDIFEKFAVTALPARIGYLNEAMGSPKTFFSSESPPIEMRYEVTLRMFLAGTWKLAALYEKAGL